MNKTFHGITKDHRGMQGLTRVPKGLQRYKDYRSIQRFTWVYKGIQGFSRDCMGVQR